MRVIAMEKQMVNNTNEAFERALAGALLAATHGDAAAATQTALQQRMLRRLVQTADDQAAARPRARLLTFGEVGRSSRSPASFWTAIAAHAAAIALIAFATTHMVHTSGRRIKPVAISSLVAPPPPPPVLRADELGGGGGQHDIAPVVQGHLPKFASEQIVAPKAPPVTQPRLAVEPTLVMQKDLKLADNNMPNLGLPTSSLHGVSLGNGSGTGLGSGSGTGIGPGSGGNIGGGILHVGGTVHAPLVIRQIDPEYSEEARKAKFSGNVEVYLWVDEQGNPSHIRVARGAGMGLDEKAIEAVAQYKFKPATQNGKPVKVDLYVDVGFQIF